MSLATALAGTGAAAATPGAITAPSIEYSQLAPMLVVFGAAVIGVLVEAFTPRELRRAVHLLLTFGALVAAFVWTCVIAASSTLFAKDAAGHVAAMGAVAVDRPTLFIQGTILVLAAVSVLLIADAPHDVSSFAGRAAALPGSSEEREGLLAGLVHTEIYPLTLFAVGGMLLFPAANDLLTMFVALETLSLPLYLLCGLARRRRLLSHEAAMKYFLLGAFSSAFFLFGIAMLYGYSGSVSLASIASEASSGTGSDTLLFAGIALTGLGLLFKVGAVPFHSWKPDVYQGAPTPITALMASCTVVSAFGALLRVFYVAFGNLTWDWRPALWVVTVLTMSNTWCFAGLDSSYCWGPPTLRAVHVRSSRAPSFTRRGRAPSSRSSPPRTRRIARPTRCPRRACPAVSRQTMLTPDRDERARVPLVMLDDAMSVASAGAPPCALVVGNFDGVHRGHQAVLRQVVADARAGGLAACVLTFDPHPAAVVAGGAPPVLTTLERRAELMGELGVDQVYVRRFDAAFAK